MNRENVSCWWRDDESKKKRKKYRRNKKLNKKASIASTTNEIENGFFWFRFMDLNSHDFFVGSVCCVDYHFDECVCYLCMIFLYHSTRFENAWSSFCLSQSRDVLYISNMAARIKIKTPCSVEYASHGTHWLCSVFFSFNFHILIPKRYSNFFQPIT